MSHSEVPAAGSPPGRSLLLVGLGVIGLVAITVAVVLLMADGAQEFPPDSPQGVVQRYLLSLEAGDYAAAYAHFSSEVRSRVDLDDYLRAVARHPDGLDGDVSRRILFDRVTEQDQRAVVHLTVEVFYGRDPFGSETYRYSRQIPLVRETGTWYIDELLLGVEAAPWLVEDAR